MVASCIFLWIPIICFISHYCLFIYIYYLVNLFALGSDQMNSSNNEEVEGNGEKDDDDGEEQEEEAYDEAEEQDKTEKEEYVTRFLVYFRICYIIYCFILLSFISPL